MEDNLNFDIDDLFKEAGIYEEENPQEPSEPEKSLDSNDADVKERTIKETEDRIAKDLGYESYEAMQKAKEQKKIDDAGLDDEQIKIVNELVEERLANDPRMKKITEIEETEKAKFVSNQLDEINKLAGEKYTSVNDLPKDVLSLWEKTGNLKQAFLAVKGEELISRPNYDKGSTAHLATPSVSHSNNKVRALTDEEKAMYRLVMPEITEEELAKKTKPVE